MPTDHEANVQRGPLAALRAVARNLRAYLTLPRRLGELSSKIEALSRHLKDLRLDEIRLRVLAIDRDRSARPPSAPAPAAAEGEPLDACCYLAFENAFRGAPDRVQEGLTQYVSLVAEAVRQSGSGRVLDLGCGRGEFLDLLRKHGIAAQGVDSSPEMVDAARGRGLDVQPGDALQALSRAPDGALAAVTAFQLVEHLAPAHLDALVKMAFFKLAPGGLLLLETVNPDSFTSLKNFYKDPTHRSPVHPNTLQFLFEYHGFKRVRVIYSSPIPESAKLTGKDENTRKLNDLLFGPQDYAVAGTR